METDSAGNSDTGTDTDLEVSSNIAEQIDTLIKIRDSNQQAKALFLQNKKLDKSHGNTGWRYFFKYKVRKIKGGIEGAFSFGRLNNQRGPSPLEIKPKTGNKIFSIKSFFFIAIFCFIFWQSLWRFSGIFLINLNSVLFFSIEGMVYYLWSLIMFYLFYFLILRGQKIKINFLGVFNVIKNIFD